MNNDQLVDVLQTSGRMSNSHVAFWHNTAGLMAAFDAIGRDGVNAVIKIDGARTDGNVYTIVISGTPLGERFFRKDGSDLASLLRDAIEFYMAIAWPDVDIH
jgi:hypothetical protein